VIGNTIRKGKRGDDASAGTHLSVLKYLLVLDQILSRG